MKKAIATLMALICLFSTIAFSSSAVDNNNDEIQASGLIYIYNLHVSKKNNTTIIIDGLTDCDPVVVRCGFKNLKVQRRANSSSSWSDYHNYGNDLVNSDTHAFYDELQVETGYFYRAICTHYAKKNIITIQTINNTSNYVAI